MYFFGVLAPQFRLLVPAIFAFFPGLTAGGTDSNTQTQLLSSVRDRDGGTVLRTRLVKTNGEEDFSRMLLQSLWTFEHPDIRLRVLTPDVAWVDAFAQSDVDGAYRSIAEAPLEWGRATLAERLGTVPRFDIDVVVVPARARYKREFRQVVADSLPLSVLVVARDDADLDHLANNALMVGTNMYLHELIHQLARGAGPLGLRPRNRVSDEAEAYLFSTCALVATGALQTVQLISGIPVSIEVAERLYGKPSGEVLEFAQQKVRDQVGKLSPSYKGSILASLALAEGAGLRHQLVDRSERDALGRFCAGSLDSRIDWTKERPCQNADLAPLCMPVQPPVGPRSSGGGANGAPQAALTAPRSAVP